MLFNVPHLLATLTVLACSLFARSALAQAPQNGSIVFNSTKDIQLSLYQPENGPSFLVDATGPANMDNTPSQAANYNSTGLLSLLTPSNYTNVRSTLAGTIAYISCDPSDYDSGFIKLSEIITSVVQSLNIGPQSQSEGAILLYSRTSRWCSFDDAARLSANIFTMTSASDSIQLYNLLMNSTSSKQISWIAAQRYIANPGSYGETAPTYSPTTTIAMIVLYSVTGIITFLFLLIIVLGAVRAHRHPERYGPRNILGLPRQSRARGMARALLDTIPIIKFGENEQSKPAGGADNVELGERDAERATDAQASAEGDNSRQKSEAGADGTATESKRDAKLHTTPASDLLETPSDVPGAATVHVEPGVTNTASPDDSSVQCPICTEDFVRGEAARHLPCHHNFHPACIDPWLLNVSSTCPLCRVDLNPPRDGVEVADAEPSVSGQGTINARQSYLGRIRRLNLSNMGSATREERIEALRQAREARAAREAEGDRGTRQGRFSRLFQSNRQSRAVSETGPASSNSSSTENVQQSGLQPGRSSNEHTNTTV